jgi:hypothetical protein
LTDKYTCSKVDIDVQPGFISIFFVSFVVKFLNFGKVRILFSKLGGGTPLANAAATSPDLSAEMAQMAQKKF